MSHKKIVLYKIRDFGAKVNATVEYIRAHFGSLIKMVLLLVVPLGLVGAISLSNIFGVAFSMASNPELSGPESMGMFSGLIGNYLLIIILTFVTYAAMFSCLYTYMRKRNDAEGDLEISDVFRDAFRKVPGVVLLIFLIGLVSFAGMFVFILPGIYLAIATSISIPIYLFEDQGVGSAFSKSFKLIGGKWWSTFGLLFITSLIANVVGYVFAVPTYIIMFGQMFSSMPEANPDPQAMMEVFSSWSTSVSMGVAMIGSYITLMIPMIALAFQYFNLSERVEGTGIKSQIDSFENLS